MMIRVTSPVRRFRCGATLLLALWLSAGSYSVVPGQTPQTKPLDKPFVVEYYYKAKWGYTAEFIRLFKKNHYPLLKKQMESGRILQLTAVAPRYHGTEDGRWDFRVTIVWKNVMTAHEEYDSEPIIKQLFPDRETFDKEEQRRFEILLAHWDLPINDQNLEK